MQVYIKGEVEEGMVEETALCGHGMGQGHGMVNAQDGKADAACVVVGGPLVRGSLTVGQRVREGVTRVHVYTHIWMIAYGCMYVWK